MKLENIWRKSDFQRLGLGDAWDAYENGKLRLASYILESNLSGSEDVNHQMRAKAFELLGLVNYDLGLAKESADAIENAGLLAPLCDAARVTLACCYAQLGHIDLARDLYLQLAFSRKLSSTLMLEVAAGLEAIDAPQIALQVCELIIEQNEDVAQAYYDMGYYSARAGNPLYLTEALTIRALELDPENIHYRVGFVSLLIQLGRDVDALRAFGHITPAVISQVNCVGCLTRITEMLRRQGIPGLASVCEDRIDRLTRANDTATSTSEQKHRSHR